MKNTSVEMLDEYMKLQTVANDHQIRGIISFASHLDIKLLKESIIKTFASIPILNSHYVATKHGNYWVPQENNLDDFISIHTTNTSIDFKEFLSNIPNEKGPQILFQVFRNEINDLLIITVNHMVMDGSGLKFYLYYLACIYSGKESDLSGSDRRIETLLKNISIPSKILTIIKKSEKKTKNIFLENVDGPAPIFLSLLKIIPSNYRKIKSYCKTHNVTINDFIISLFAKAIFNVKDSFFSNITIQVMFNLRQYEKKYFVSKYGNFASMESVTIHNGREFSDILIEVHKSMNKIKNRLPGVKNILLMHLAFSIFPKKVFNSLLVNEIKLFSVSTSNLGVIDDQQLQFLGVIVDDAYILTSIKKQPAIQLSFSTFKETMTLSVLGRYSKKSNAIIRNIFESMKTIIIGCISDIK